MNPLTGGHWDSEFDKDISGVVALCDTLKTSAVTELSLANCRLGPGSLGKLAEYVHDADAAVASLRCGNNPGMVGKLDRYGLETPDAHAKVFKELTDSLKTSQVTEADFSSCGIGPVALGHLGEWVRDAKPALNSLTLDSTGVVKMTSGPSHMVKASGPRTYTLTTGEEKIDLSKKNLGSADVALVAAWLQRPGVMAAVARLSLSDNMITSSSRGWGGNWTYDADLSGLMLLCDALPALKNPIDLDLTGCGLSTNGMNPVIHAIRAGGVGAINLARCQLEPPIVAQVLSVASEVSRSHLRVAQVLAFCCALHDRMGADSAICDMVDNLGVVDIWQRSLLPSRLCDLVCALVRN